MVRYTQMSLREFEARARRLNVRYGMHETPFGKCQLGLSDLGICHLSFDHVNYGKESMPPMWHNANFILDQELTKEVLDNIIKGKTDDIDIFSVGSDFQHEVWRALLEIPYGTTVCYEQVAKMIERPKAVRAVATAIGQNNIGYIIPCHRVISKTGKINKYRWGADIKRKMLIYENPVLLKSFNSLA